MDPQEKAFRDAITEAPEDELVRRAFADWLEESDRPEEALPYREWTLKAHREAVATIEACANECEMMPDRLMQKLDGLTEDGYLHFSFDTPDCMWNPRELWEAYEVVTCRKVTRGKSECIGSCSC